MLNHGKAQKLNHKTIREQVAAHIRNLILQGELKPGERVLEQEIADVLGVSRGPVRESLRQLEQEGLLEYRRNRGCVVRKFSKEDAAEVFFLRSILESSSVELCGGILSSEILDAMEHVLEQMKIEMDRGSVTGFVEQDQIFHGLIAKACGMDRLYTLWNNLNSVGIALFLTDSRKNFQLKEQFLRHKKVLDALKSGDLSEEKKVIVEHYSTGTVLNG